MRNQTLFYFAAASCFTFGALTAQAVIDDERRDLFSGFGGATYGPIDLDTVTGQNGNLGCAFLNNEIFVTARGNAGGTAAPHTCHVFDMSGNLLRSFQQQGSAASPWGWRDGDSDRILTLVFGYEASIAYVDANGNPTTQIISNNGLQTLPAPIVTPTYTGTALATVRGVAYDPAGNAGNGSIFAADFGTDIVELSLSGAEIGRIPFNGSWSIYGLALHPVTGNLWANSSPNGYTGKIVEIDRVTGQETGNAIEHTAGIQGGLEFVPGGLNGRNAGADLLAVVQGTPVDQLTGHRLDLYNTLLGTSGNVDLLARKNNGVLTDAAVIVGNAGDTSWSIDLDDGDPTPRAIDIGAYAINVPPFSAVNGVLDPAVATLFPELSEIRALTGFTQPMGGTLFVSAAENDPPLTLPVAGLLNLGMTGDYIRVQGLYADFNVPGTIKLMFTNQTRFQIDAGPALGVTVQASGTDSFNNITTSGFFSIANNGPYEIISATLVLPGTMTYDEDQGGMADVFWGGNSALAGCRGTYRNGSDVATGLDYSATAAAGCDATALKGYVLPATNTLLFTWVNGGFTTGELFEWDVDTDGGGLSGADHEGMAVTITVRDPIGGQTITSSRRLFTTQTALTSTATF